MAIGLSQQVVFYPIFALCDQISYDTSNDNALKGIKK